ncbi:hypothetical protein L1987_03413 [Smallanthus sonchifolius]|uniref:Uncharacterized protein n=1 Tax=Smallanthus sonchifolius TaxID=185202 RepID=A0ACB9KAL4_9ASTR|nr:hypothetical protein L1987_03413 [Smallanthus sonchifolius]
MHTKQHTVREPSKRPTNCELNEMKKLRNEIGKLIPQGIANAIPTISAEVKNLEGHSKRTRNDRSHSAHITYRPYTKKKPDKGSRINDNTHKVEVENKNEAEGNNRKQMMVVKYGNG